jgi:probable rRNA maturation factor
MSRITLDVQRQSRLWPAVATLRPLIRRAAQAAVDSAGVTLLPGAEIAIALADDATIREVNRTYRGFHKPTNVLSFPSVTGKALARAPMLGDIMISHETLTREAEAEGKSFEAHLCHLVVHGVLHLLGFDHEKTGEAEKMESLETAILQKLGLPDPYAGSVAETGGRL